MSVAQCSDQEMMTLVAIASLAASLPKSLMDYTDALIQINRNYFKSVEKRPRRNPAGRSITQARTIRAS